MKQAIVLMYHIIDQARDSSEAKYCCPPKRFEKQMRYLSQSAYVLASLDNLADLLDGGVETSETVVVVTFDDGFSCFYNNALPILRRYNIPATIFMVADRIGGSNDWMHDRGFPARSMMSAAQLLELKEVGVAIGSHTQTHPRLTEIERDHMVDELGASKRKLEALLGATVSHFAYPFGLLNHDVRNAVREAGYRTACSTRSGFNRPDVDRYALRRIEIYGSDSLWQFHQKLKFGTNDTSIFFPLKYYGGRLARHLGF